MHNRKSPRAFWHDYNGGLYFVTIVTQNRKPYFGSITDGVMHLSPIGQILEKHITALLDHFPYANNVQFVIMPNHVHLLVYVDKDKAATYHRSHKTVVSLSQHQKRSHYFSDVAQLQGLLSVIIGGIKSATTREVRKLGLAFGWQSRFHDHIVKGHDDWMLINDYIYHNVERWSNDMFNPSKK